MYENREADGVASQECEQCRGLAPTLYTVHIPVNSVEAGAWEGTPEIFIFFSLEILHVLAFYALVL